MRPALVALLLLVLVGASTVHLDPAAENRPVRSRLELSRTGRQWSPSLTTPVFERDVVLVPGGPVQRASFLVRNRSTGKARLRVLVRADDPDRWLDEKRLRMMVRAGSKGRWVRVRGPLTRRPGTLVLRPRKVVPITVSVRLRRRAGDATQERHLSFSLELRLTQRTKKRHR